MPKSENRNSPMVKKLLHTRYRVHDLEKTVAFYRDVLGLEEVAPAHFAAAARSWFFSRRPAATSRSRFANSTRAAPCRSARTSRISPLRWMISTPLPNTPPRKAIRSPTARTRGQRQRDRLYRRSGRLRDRADPTRQSSRTWILTGSTPRSTCAKFRPKEIEESFEDPFSLRLLPDSRRRRRQGALFQPRKIDRRPRDFHRFLDRRKKIPRHPRARNDARGADFLRAQELGDRAS